MSSLSWTYVMLKSGRKLEADFDAIIQVYERCEAIGVVDETIRKRKADALQARDELRAGNDAHSKKVRHLN